MAEITKVGVRPARPGDPSLRIRVISVGEFLNVEESLEAWRPRAFDAVTKATDMLHAEIDRSLSRRMAEPAPRGGPPREHTGKLRRSFKKIKVRLAKYHARGGIRSRHPGANKLEYITHPFVRPAIAKLAPAIMRLFEAT